MPFTPCHIAAVLPLKRFAPNRLDFVALALGSMMPDIAYFIPLPWGGRLTHSIDTSLLICVPLGLVFYLFVRLAFDGLSELLPVGHRNFMRSQSKASLFTDRFIPVLLSLAIGAWTHVFWDGWTHAYGYFVTLLPLLKSSLFGTFRVYHLLQHASSLLGAALLIGSYRRAFIAHHENRSGRQLGRPPGHQPRKQPLAQLPEPLLSGDQLFLFWIATLTLAIFAIAAHVATSSNIPWELMGARAIQTNKFLFESVTIFISAVALVVMATAAWLELHLKRKAN